MARIFTNAAAASFSFAPLREIRVFSKDNVSAPDTNAVTVVVYCTASEGPCVGKSVSGRRTSYSAFPRSMTSVMFLKWCSCTACKAAKFVAPGTRPSVGIRAQDVGCDVRLWIEDDGIGIEPRDQKRIFNMFERVHSEGAYEGTGIGLAIVRKAAERMGGSVGVQSDFGHGSKFWIQLKKG
jgi:hypothetical protein